MFADYHTHTEFSDDSIYPMEQAVQDAIAMGMDEICFTDHVDYGIKEDWDCGHPIAYRGDEPLANVDYPKYFSRIQHMQHMYQSQINIKMGLEFGMQMHTISQYKELFQKYPFDFIILSVHQIEDQELWTQDFQRGRSQKECYERYYEELLGIVTSYSDFSVLGHMDLIARYDKNGGYPYQQIEPIIAEILKVIIKNGKGIEFNTSYRRYRLKDTTPSMNILQLYQKLGGEIITIGSDSHSAEHLGAYIEEAKQILSTMGFRYFCTYDKMKPIYHSVTIHGKP